MAGPRTAFVSGASSGLGYALARRMARDGVEVAVAARREERLATLVGEILDAGGQARAVELDVSDPEATVAAVQRMDDELGGLDVVVANAGVGQTKWSGKLQWSDCPEVISVNVIGATATLAAILPRMVERKHGHLVGVSSLAQYRGLPRNAVYSASKAFLSTFLEGLRVDLRTTGVRVTDVRPGFIKTPMTEGNKSMPFVMDADAAAAEVYGAILAGRAVHAFPLPTAAAMRSVSALPNALYDALAPKILG